MLSDYDNDFNPEKTNELCSMLKYYLNRSITHIAKLENEICAEINMI